MQLYLHEQNLTNFMCKTSKSIKLQNQETGVNQDI
jgi:hypothetical protein